MTPYHTIDNSTIEPQIIIPNYHMKRYIVCNPPKKIRCMERLVPSMLNNIKYACISTKYSPSYQANNIIKLLNVWNMLPSDTNIMILDFKGDTPTNGQQSTIISPELDAYSLNLGNILQDHNYKVKLTVCFPGVDGELSSDYLTDICLNHSIESIPISFNDWYSNLNDIYNYIKDERSGNTIPNMLRILKHPDCEKNYSEKVLASW